MSALPPKAHIHEHDRNVFKGQLDVAGKDRSCRWPVRAISKGTVRCVTVIKGGPRSRGDCYDYNDYRDAYG
jgi:hypothetical protein